MLYLIFVITLIGSCYSNFKDEDIKAQKNYGTFQKLYRQKMEKGFETIFYCLLKIKYFAGLPFKLINMNLALCLKS